MKIICETFQTGYKKNNFKSEKNGFVFTDLESFLTRNDFKRRYYCNTRNAGKYWKCRLSSISESR